jgi:hypothetical protein
MPSVLHSKDMLNKHKSFSKRYALKVPGMLVFTGPIKVPFLGWRKQREQTFTNARINHLKEAIMWLLGKTALITAAGQRICHACALPL